MLPSGRLLFELSPQGERAKKTMKISILSVFAELYTPFLSTSLIKRAIEKKVVSVNVDQFFSFVSPKERIDAPTFGHGPGMLIKPEVVARAIEAKEAAHGPAFKIFFSPGGKKLDQCLVREIVQKAQDKGHLMLLPARYEGMDARVEQKYADAVISVGDFVLMGGDAAALMLLEALLRLIPGVVGKQESVEEESFSGPFVEYPHYTEPVNWQGMEVPEVIRSGNHAAMREWRMQEAAKRSVLGHFDWLREHPMTEEERKLVRSNVPSHYCALMHSDVLVSDKKIPGTTSVTSIDIHDISRSASTYGIRQFFIVTPLEDQQKIVRQFLDFWMTEGPTYNIQRHEAVRNASIAGTIEEAIAVIEQKEGARPIVIATSAREIAHPNIINFDDQSKVWQSGRPVLFIFGTGRGLTEERIAQADYLLKPVKSLTDYNHLSVRSAVAIIFDRWLGISEKKCR